MTIDIFTANGGELAEWLHDTYEAIAKEKGWKTQESTQVKFKDLPEANKSVMLNLAQCIQILIATGSLKHGFELGK